MKTNLRFRNSILYIKIDGVLVGNKVQQFESEVIPIILGLKTKYVTINLKNVELIDKRGIDSLIKIADLTNRFKGKVALCELSKYIIDNFKHSDIFDYCFKTKNENTSLEVFKL